MTLDLSRSGQGFDPRSAAAVADRIGALAEELLGRPIATDTNFFEAGFSSLTLVELHDRLVQRLGLRLPETALFDKPNIAALAASVAAAEAPPPEAGPSGGAVRTGGARSRRDLRAQSRRGRGTAR